MLDLLLVFEFQTKGCSKKELWHSAEVLSASKSCRAGKAFPILPYSDHSRKRIEVFCVIRNVFLCNHIKGILDPLLNLSKSYTFYEQS